MTKKDFPSELFCGVALVEMTLDFTKNRKCKAFSQTPPFIVIPNRSDDLYNRNEWKRMRIGKNISHKKTSKFLPRFQIRRRELLHVFRA